MQLNGHQLYSIACSLARVLLLRGLRDIMRVSSARYTYLSPQPKQIFCHYMLKNKHFFLLCLLDLESWFAVFVCVSACCPQVLRSAAAVTAVKATATTGPQIIHGFWKEINKSGETGMSHHHMKMLTRRSPKLWDTRLAIKIDAMHK